ncbi:hypothetical protein PRZ48_007117 [Zasmidium cellare]|uniref:Uncharacterized protein n=1 Tax=Zasmidium cellare TaxID=395010 RepID=A0ABR0EIJ1_ZASCE|nr:hypothetical protein PRZ48_007117 [Zasmidium cellare]
MPSDMGASLWDPESSPHVPSPAMEDVHDAEDQSPMYHAFDILIADVDAVKNHYKNADYKYKNNKRIPSSLRLLARQYDLKHKKDSRTMAPLTPLAGDDLLTLFKPEYTAMVSSNFSQFWTTGSKHIPRKFLDKVRGYSKYAQETYGMLPHGFGSDVTWEYSLVEKTLQTCERSDACVLPDFSGSKQPQGPLTQVGMLGDRATSSPDAPLAVKQSIGADAPSRIANKSKTDLVRDATVIPSPRAPKRRRADSQVGAETATIDISSTAGSDIQQTATSSREEEFDIDETTKIMGGLSGDLGNLVRQLFKHFDLQQNLQMVFNSKITLAGLQDLYKTCWGDDWRKVIKQNRKYLLASDVVQSLVSAYLHLHVFQSDASEWIKFAEKMDASPIYALVKEALRPTFHLSGQFKIKEFEARTNILPGHSTASAISTMLLSGDVTQLQHYHNILKHQLPSCMLRREDVLKSTSNALANELFDTLDPLLNQLNEVAVACNPDEDFSDWRAKLQAPLYQLIERALKIKRNTRPNGEYAFQYVWGEFGTPVNHDSMEAKAPSEGVSVIVLTTLVPGLLCQQKGQQKWSTLQAAEILEKVQENGSAQVQVLQTTPKSM